MVDSAHAIETLLQLLRRDEIEWDMQITQRVVAAHRALDQAGQELTAAQMAVSWGHAAVDVDSMALADALCARAEVRSSELTGEVSQELRRLRARIVPVVPLGLTLAQARTSFEARDEIPFAVLHATAIMFPDWSALLGSVAWHWARRGLFEEAEDLFRAGLHQSPQDGSMLWGLGLVMLSRGADEQLGATLDRLEITTASGLADPARLLRERLAERQV
ncbi:MAG: hypothetical protein ACI9MC_003108 [Kiritimatiellia bacterium]